MTKKLIIEGMSCQHCIHAVKHALEGVSGVRVERVSLGEADVTFDPSRVEDSDLVAAVEEEGYTVRGVEG